MWKYFGENFKITNIAILDGKNGLYVQMPRYRTNELDEKGKNVYRDFCNPTTKEFREELYGNVLQQYREAKNKGVKEKIDEPKKEKSGKKTEKKQGTKSSKSSNVKKKFASIMNECEKWFANDREYLHIYSSGKKIILKKDSVLYIKKGKEIYTKDFCVCSNDVVELVSESNFFTNRCG